jgi:hypothetical protein
MLGGVRLWPVISGIVPAAPGFRVTVGAATQEEAEGAPAPSDVVAWATVTDPEAVGGLRVDPVFLAAGRAWTPDQYRTAYGETLTVKVVRV